ncbi:hypothetical protein KBI23_01330 [bacterium]|nr:hypothetical protein [bacterium]MBP9807085.1 hypothetical protein [bacterium]
MTIQREEMAAIILQGMLSNAGSQFKSVIEETAQVQCDEHVANAVKYADALIAELEKNKSKV